MKLLPNFRQSSLTLKKPKRKLSKLAKQEERAAYLFLSPWLIGFLVFLLGPQDSQSDIYHGGHNDRVLFRCLDNGNGGNQQDKAWRGAMDHHEKCHSIFHGPRVNQRLKNFL